MSMVEELGEAGRALKQLLSTPSWHALTLDFQKSEEVFLVGNGGNLSVLTHLVSDFKRSHILKRYVVPNEIVHYSNFVRESGPNEHYRQWLAQEKILSKRPLLIAVASSSNSQAILNMLNAPEGNGFCKYLITFDQSQVVLSGVTHINLNLKTFQSGELALLALGYELGRTQGLEPKRIESKGC